MSPDDEASVASLSTVSDIHLKSRDEFNNQVSENKLYGNYGFLLDSTQNFHVWLDFYQPRGGMVRSCVDV